jgi:lipopolysaccharide transport system ATP-binding protein
MAEPAIVCEGAWKKFQQGEHHDSLRDLIPALAKRLVGAKRSTDLNKKEFWALNDVSFSVKPGDALGVIGPNGAGKSTLLKLLTKILKPTRGSCSVRGRVGALIEIAAGFHPDLTGRENVFLQGSIMGMKKSEVTRNFDRIVEFAEVSDFIDTPVKRYSSGMNARLGFAIAAHLNPDVLIVDEVLSVGDTGFQARCLARMREILAQGVPLVFVSHNLQAIQELCNRSLLLKRGEVAFEGDPRDAIQEYRRMVWSPPGETEELDHTGKDVAIRGVQLLDEEDNPSDSVATGRSLTLRILYQAARDLDRVHFAVDIHRGDGVCCYGINTNMDGETFGVTEGKGHVDLFLPRITLLPNYYTLSVGIHDQDCMSPHDVHTFAYPFSVTSNRKDSGIVFLDHEWRQPGKKAAVLTSEERPGDRR